jgi:hypothetical protein
VGSLAGSTGAYNFSGGGIGSSSLTIGSAGTGVFSQSAGYHSASQISLGKAASGNGTYQLTGGTLTTTTFAASVHQMGFLQDASGMVIGNLQGSHGTLTHTGSAILNIYHGALLVGYGGSGTVIHTGGSIWLQSEDPIFGYPSLAMASNPGSSGSYFLSGTAVLESIGPENLGGYGAATFTQTGGFHIISNFDLYIGGFGISVYNLSGGTLLVSASGATFVGGTGASTFTQTGGNFTSNSGLTVGHGSIQGDPASYALSGGALTTPTITVHATGQFTYTGGMLATSTLRILGGKVSFNNNSATRVDALTFAGTSNAWQGQLDLHTSALVLQTTGSADKLARIPTLQNQILSANAGGAWNGAGITSTAIPLTPNTALALADNADLHFTAFRGQTVDEHSLILTIARLGDATLDGKVDALDLNLLAAHWNVSSGALWSSGDFTGDGAVNAFDLNLLAANWQYSAGSSLAMQSVLVTSIAAVPEPASASLLIVPWLVRRRRTR